MNKMDSYPPILRLPHNQLQNLHDPNDIKGHDPIQNPDPIPIIDLKSLNHKNLDEACKEWGLFRLVNHGVPITLLEQLEDLTKQLFSLSFETKQEACNESPITYFWGTPALTPSGTAITRGPQNINWVEGFDVPLCQLSHFQHQLPSLESMRLLLMDYATHLSRIATTLFEAMSKNLELNLKSTKSYVSENTGIVRVYRYPCTDVGWGMEVHTDSSVLSILNQDNHVSGLQVLKHDQWLTVKPIFNTLIVNLGDMMQAISCDRYKSASHRVKVEKNIERVSICYFVFPGEDVVIESSKYKPFTYNEFRAQVALAAKQRGASMIIGVDLNQDKFEIGKQFGVTDFVNPSSCNVKSVIKDLTNGGADYCFECIGLASLMAEAFNSSREGWGKTVIIGVEMYGSPLTLNPYTILKGRTITGSLFGGIKAKSDIPHQKYLDKEINLDGFILQEVDFKDINKASDYMVQGKSIRCIIKMDH